MLVLLFFLVSANTRESFSTWSRAALQIWVIAVEDVVESVSVGEFLDSISPYTDVLSLSLSFLSFTYLFLYSSWGPQELDTTEYSHKHFLLFQPGPQICFKLKLPQKMLRT